MSYSVHTPCGNCEKRKKCTDGVVVTGAVQGIIHQMPYDVGHGHLGSGSVTMACFNHEVEPDH
jgi:hypothetical protein